jgi:cytochrome P450
MRAAQLGDVVLFHLGPQPVYLVNHPDYIRDVLVTHSRNFIKSRGLQIAKKFLGESLLTSEGEFHLRQRRLAQPAFHRQRINSYAQSMVEYGARTCDRWREGETVDISHEMMRLTLAIVGKTLFDADVESEAKDIREALNAMMQMFDRITKPFPSFLGLLPLPSNFRLRRAHRRLDETIYRIINERRASGEDRGDLLSMLLMSTDTEGDGTGMSNLQVRNEAMTLFIAGHETTANALMWTWYLLSHHPEIEARLHREIDSVLQGRTPEADDFARLKYVEMVFAESMRLYPPAWVMGRQVLADYPIDRYMVPTKSIILMSPYAMHHDERYYPDPFRFDPDRWTEEARASRPKFSYFPFGGGPRVCIGEQFAWMEGVLLIATIASQWKLRLAPGQEVKPKPIVTLRPGGSVMMTLERRERSQNLQQQVISHAVANQSNNPLI